MTKYFYDTIALVGVVIGYSLDDPGLKLWQRQTIVSLL
jgi:hypothetical protein